MKPLDDQQVRQILDARQRGEPWRVRAALRGVLQAVLAVAVLAGGWLVTRELVASRPEVVRRPPAERVYSIETVTARLGSHRPTIRAYGAIAAARTVELRALVAGTVTAVRSGLRAGATVAAGDVLVEIDRFDYLGAVTQAEADLAEAEARLVESRARLVLERDAVERTREQLAFSRRDLERVTALHARGRMTDKELDERKLLVSEREQAVEQRVNNVRIQEAVVRQQEAALARLEWGVREAERNLADTSLRAPFAGVILSESVEVGRALNENDVAVSMYDADALEARFQLTDRQYGDILADAGTVVGRPVEIRWHVGDVPVGAVGTISRAGAEISAEKGGVEVHAVLDGEGLARQIRPGAFVEIDVPGRLYRDTYELPESTLYDGDHVFVVVDDRLSRREVSVVGSGEGSVFVTGALENGNTVLATRVAEAGEGLKVRTVSQLGVEPRQTSAGQRPRSPFLPARAHSTHDHE